jgi:hypothetical protein
MESDDPVSRIWGSHSNRYEEANISIQRHVIRSKSNTPSAWIDAGLLLGLFFGPEDRGEMISKKTADFQRTTLHQIPEHTTLRIYEWWKDAFWGCFDVLRHTAKTQGYKYGKKIVYISAALFLKLKCCVLTKSWMMMMMMMTTNVKTEVLVNFQRDFRDFQGIFKKLLQLGYSVSRKMRQGLWTWSIWQTRHQGGEYKYLYLCF